MEDYGSLGSEEKGELDGDEVIEILDPTTGEVIEPDSVSFDLRLFLRALAWRSIHGTAARSRPHKSTPERRYVILVCTLTICVVVLVVCVRPLLGKIPNSKADVHLSLFCQGSSALLCFSQGLSLFRTGAGTFYSRVR